jgi:predicted PurR-regulated permease PerM
LPHRLLTALPVPVAFRTKVDKGIFERARDARLCELQRFAARAGARHTASRRRTVERTLVTAPEADGARAPGDESLPHVALLTLVSGVVALAVTAATLALWEGRVVVLLLFLAYTLGAAMRPGVDSLVRAGIPRALALVGHFALFFGLIALLLWLIVPVAFDQTQHALADLPRHDAATDQGIFHSVREQALSWVESQLRGISEPDMALSTLVGTLAALAGAAFTFSAAAYWVVERDRLVNVVLAVVPHEKRATVRDTWLLIDFKLGAVIRTKLLLVLMTASILSFAFWVIGLPYFLLVAVFAGIVEILPVIGPLIAGLTAVAAGLTVSWQLGLAAAIVVYGLRIVQDYVINPRLFGRAVHLPPLAVLLAVSAVALLLGPWWVPLAIPLTAVVSTLLDVLVWKGDPAEKEVPTVLIPTDETVGDRRRRPWRDSGRVSKDAGRA